MIVTDDPQDAGELAWEKQPGLILLDIILPENGGETPILTKRIGYDILKRLSGHPETKKIPVVVFSNLNSLEDQKKSKALCAKEYIIKADVLPKDLIPVVDKYLK